MGFSAVKVSIMNLMSFKFNYLENVNALKLRSVRSQEETPSLSIPSAIPQTKLPPPKGEGRGGGVNPGGGLGWGSPYTI
jgi:hypothetical protein